MSTDRAYILLAFRIIADFGASLAVPAVVSGWIGLKLDNRFDTKPILTIVCLALSAALSAIFIYKKAKKYGREYNNIGPK